MSARRSSRRKGTHDHHHPYNPHRSEVAVVEPEFRIPAVDLYRDIHKGIRAELFTVTSTAGSIDPSDRCDHAALADHIASVAAVLESHAHHEDAVIDPVLERHLPQLANEINTDHERLETMFASITDLAGATIDAAAAEQRRLLQLLHLDLARFASAYLDHIDLEERAVMQRLPRADRHRGDRHVTVRSSARSHLTRWPGAWRSCCRR